MNLVSPGSTNKNHSNGRTGAFPSRTWTRFRHRALLGEVADPPCASGSRFSTPDVSIPASPAPHRNWPPSRLCRHLNLACCPPPGPSSPAGALSQPLHPAPGLALPRRLALRSPCLRRLVLDLRHPQTAPPPHPPPASSACAAPASPIRSGSQSQNPHGRSSDDQPRRCAWWRRDGRHHPLRTATYRSPWRRLFLGPTCIAAGWRAQLPRYALRGGRNRRDIQLQTRARVFIHDSAGLKSSPNRTAKALELLQSGCAARPRPTRLR